MIPNQVTTAPVWRIDAQALLDALSEFSLGRRKMSEAQLKAATLLINIAGKMAKMPKAEDDTTLEDLA